jgi:acyl-CoA thioester hydrolase
MDPEIAALLIELPVVVTLPVQWGDQDAYLHVNNTVYFRWFESARIAYTLRLGFGESMRQRKVGPILAAISCDFRRQITFPDTVHVGSRITRIGRTSFSLDHVLVSEANRAVAAEARSTIVVFDYTAGRPVPVPDDIRQAISALEGKSL